MIYFSTKSARKRAQGDGASSMSSDDSLLHAIDSPGLEKPITIYSKKFSESCQSEERIFYNNKRAALYKTEMCRSFSELGACKYGDSCQFCHSEAELRVVERHPKYKTEICRTFWLEGSCPYGKRCCFAHLDNAGLIEKAKMLSTKQKPAPQDNAQLSAFILDINDESPADADGYRCGPLRDVISRRLCSGMVDRDLIRDGKMALKFPDIACLRSGEPPGDGGIAQDLFSKKDDRPGPEGHREYFTFNRHYGGYFEPAVPGDAKDRSTAHVNTLDKNALRVWCDEPLNFVPDTPKSSK